MAALYQTLTTLPTLYAAWKHIRMKKAAGGIDGVSIAQFEEDLNHNLTDLQKQLIERSWNPEPYMLVEIPKRDNEKRKLGLLAIKDKIVQQAIKTLVEPRFENLFTGNSYGYRTDKGAAKAIRRCLAEFRSKKYQWVVKLDIDNYFDTIQHELLFQRMAPLIKDTEILRLIRLSVKTGVVTKKLKWSEPMTGLPQGAVLSPLLANFYLHPFDQFVVSKVPGYIRYADDFIVLTQTKIQAEEILSAMSGFLTKRLFLHLNPPEITNINTGVTFLGLHISHSGIRLTDEKKEKMIAKINALDFDYDGFTRTSLKYLDGIRHYYARLLPPEILESLDHVLIQRLRWLVKEKGYLFDTQKLLLACLNHLSFFTGQNELAKNTLLKEFVKIYTESKAAKKKIEQIESEKKNKKLILSKKKEYRKREGEGAELVVHSFNTFIGISSKGLILKTNGKRVNKEGYQWVSHITVLSKGVSISSNAIDYCMEHKIPVDFFDGRGKHYASILSPAFLETTLWRQQADMNRKRCNILALRIILGKLKNQQNLVKYFHKYHKGRDSHVCSQYEQFTSDSEKLIKKLKLTDVNREKFREEVMGIESQGAICYWNYIKILLADDQISFEGRERKGAQDLFNSLLNYGYALLYARVWQALLAAKLNPYDSVLHCRQPGRPAFVYDVVELFRSQAVDRVVIALIQKGEPLSLEQNLLSDNTKKLLISNIFERLNRYEKYRGTEIKFSKIIKQQAKEIAAYIQDDALFRPYLAKW